MAESKLTEPRRSNWKLNYTSLQAAESREYGYRIGNILTRHGAVGFYDQIGGERRKEFTRFDMVVAGRHHSAIWDRRFTDRYLKTLASRFAAALQLQGGSEQ